ncbi:MULTISPECIES: VirB3 family type IV secretion system protein [unclassified Stenotrophomonas]|uniref:type IV secretion system protein VirB3 n=1 Tax=unclassified Stenotrophomonas TaxID=196198 RepID=UPI0025CC92EB|nr:MULTISPECIES: VirB3 family type IV secretion system protein [unclassified Stenotrophomonas]
MHKNALFRGCTRPAMFLGVPYMPFTIAAGTCLLLTFYFDMFFLFLLPIVVLIMRQMARRDEMVFRLLGLRWQFRSKIRNVKHHNGMWVFTPNNYRKTLENPSSE